MIEHIVDDHHRIGTQVGEFEFGVSHWPKNRSELNGVITLSSHGCYFQESITPEEARELANALMKYADDFEARSAAMIDRSRLEAA